MTVVAYSDVENTVKRWLATTSVAPLVQRSPGVYSIHLAMPKSAPIPVVVLTLISGYPTPRKDLPQETSRIQFDCWGASRQQASDIAIALIGELESLSLTGGYVDGPVYLGSAAVAGKRWLPDPQSDTPRYIVDALITTVQ